MDKFTFNDRMRRARATFRYNQNKKDPAWIAEQEKKWEAVKQSVLAHQSLRAAKEQAEKADAYAAGIKQMQKDLQKVLFTLHALLKYGPDVEDEGTPMDRLMTIRAMIHDTLDNLGK